jgi:hypothetical protein
MAFPYPSILSLPLLLSQASNGTFMDRTAWKYFAAFLELAPENNPWLDDITFLTNLTGEGEIGTKRPPRG